MKFEIDFNREPNDTLLIELGATFEPTNATKYGPFKIAMIEIEGFTELEQLLKKLDNITGSTYTALVSFDAPMIYLDNNI